MTRRWKRIKKQMNERKKYIYELEPKKKVRKGGEEYITRKIITDKERGGKR